MSEIRYEIVKQIGVLSTPSVLRTTTTRFAGQRSPALLGYASRSPKYDDRNSGCEFDSQIVGFWGDCAVRVFCTKTR